MTKKSAKKGANVVDMMMMVESSPPSSPGKKKHKTKKEKESKFDWKKKKEVWKRFYRHTPDKETISALQKLWKSHNRTTSNDADDEEEDDYNSPFWQEAQVHLEQVSRLYHSSSEKKQTQEKKQKKKHDDTTLYCIHASVLLTLLDITTVDMVAFAVWKYHEQTSLRDAKRRLPLHLAVSISPTTSSSSSSQQQQRQELFKILLQVHPEAASCKMPSSSSKHSRSSNSSSAASDTSSRYPLLTALAHQHCWHGGVKDLYENFPEAVCQVDAATGLYPYQLAAVPTTTSNDSSNGNDDDHDNVDDDIVDLDTIYSLLRAEPGVLGEGENDDDEDDNMDVDMPDAAKTEDTLQNNNEQSVSSSSPSYKHKASSGAANFVRKCPSRKRSYEYQSFDELAAQKAKAGSIYQRRKEVGFRDLGLLAHIEVCQETRASLKSVGDPEALRKKKIEDYMDEFKRTKPRGNHTHGVSEYEVQEKLQSLKQAEMIPRKKKEDYVQGSEPDLKSPIHLYKSKLKPAAAAASTTPTVAAEATTLQQQQQQQDTLLPGAFSPPPMSSSLTSTPITSPKKKWTPKTPQNGSIIAAPAFSMPSPMQTLFGNMGSSKNKQDKPKSTALRVPILAAATASQLQSPTVVKQQQQQPVQNAEPKGEEVEEKDESKVAATTTRTVSSTPTTTTPQHKNILGQHQDGSSSTVASCIISSPMQSLFGKMVSSKKQNIPNSTALVPHLASPPQSPVKPKQQQQQQQQVQREEQDEGLSSSSQKKPAVVSGPPSKVVQEKDNDLLGRQQQQQQVVPPSPFQRQVSKLRISSLVQTQSPQIVVVPMEKEKLVVVADQNSQEPQSPYQTMRQKLKPASSTKKLQHDSRSDEEEPFSTTTTLAIANKNNATALPGALPLTETVNEGKECGEEKSLSCVHVDESKFANVVPIPFGTTTRQYQKTSKTVDGIADNSMGECAETIKMADISKNDKLLQFPTRQLVPTDCRNKQEQEVESKERQSPYQALRQKLRPASTKKLQGDSVFKEELPTQPGVLNGILPGALPLTDIEAMIQKENSVEKEASVHVNCKEPTAAELPSPHGKQRVGDSLRDAKTVAGVSDESIAQCETASVKDVDTKDDNHFIFPSARWKSQLADASRRRPEPKEQGTASKEPLPPPSPYQAMRQKLRPASTKKLQGDSLFKEELPTHPGVLNGILLGALPLTGIETTVQTENRVDKGASVRVEPTTAEMPTSPHGKQRVGASLLDAKLVADVSSDKSMSLCATAKNADIPKNDKPVQSPTLQLLVVATDCRQKHEQEIKSKEPPPPLPSPYQAMRQKLRPASQKKLQCGDNLFKEQPVELSVNGILPGALPLIDIQTTIQKENHVEKRASVRADCTELPSRDSLRDAKTVADVSSDKSSAQCGTVYVEDVDAKDDNLFIISSARWKSQLEDTNRRRPEPNEQGAASKEPPPPSPYQAMRQKLRPASTKKLQCDSPVKVQPTQLGVNGILPAALHVPLTDIELTVQKEKQKGASVRIDFTEPTAAEIPTAPHGKQRDAEAVADVSDESSSEQCSTLDNKDVNTKDDVIFMNISSSRIKSQSEDTSRRRPEPEEQGTASKETTSSPYQAMRQKLRPASTKKLQCDSCQEDQQTQPETTHSHHPSALPAEWVKAMSKRNINLEAALQSDVLAAQCADNLSAVGTQPCQTNDRKTSLVLTADESHERVSFEPNNGSVPTAVDLTATCPDNKKATPTGRLSKFSSLFSGWSSSSSEKEKVTAKKNNAADPANKTELLSTVIANATAPSVTKESVSPTNKIDVEKPAISNKVVDVEPIEKSKGEVVVHSSDQFKQLESQATTVSSKNAIADTEAVAKTLETPKSDVSRSPVEVKHAEPQPAVALPKTITDAEATTNTAKEEDVAMPGHGSESPQPAAASGGTISKLGSLLSGWGGRSTEPPKAIAESGEKDSNTKTKPDTATKDTQPAPPFKRKALQRRISAENVLRKRAEMENRAQTLKAHKRLEHYRVQCDKARHRRAADLERKQDALSAKLIMVNSMQQAFPKMAFETEEIAAIIAETASKHGSFDDLVVDDATQALETSLVQNMHNMIALEKQLSMMKKQQHDLRKYLVCCQAWLQDCNTFHDNMYELEAQNYAMNAVYRNTLRQQESAIYKYSDLL